MNTLTWELFDIIRNQSITDAISYMSKEKIGVDVQDNKGYTLLMHASQMGEIEEMKRLLDMGASVNMRNTFNETPLHVAASCVQPEAIKLLLQHGAYINAENKYGSTALISVIGSRRIHDMQKAVESIKVLIQNNINVDMVNQFGHTAITLAKSRKMNELVHCIEETHLQKK